VVGSNTVSIRMHKSIEDNVKFVIKILNFIKIHKIFRVIPLQLVVSVTMVSDITQGRRTDAGDMGGLSNSYCIMHT